MIHAPCVVRTCTFVQNSFKLGSRLPIRQYAHSVRFLRNPSLLLALLTFSGSAVLEPATFLSRPQERHANKDEGWAEKTLKTLSVEEKVGQLFMIRMRVEFLHGQSPDYVQLRDNIRKYHSALWPCRSRRKVGHAM